MRVTLAVLAFLLLLPATCLADGSVYVVPIEGTIERGLAAFISRVMEEAEAEGVSAVVFEIDTPGGALDAAVVIRDAILYSDVKTIAFINPRAISAGALISLATRHIVMVEGGTIGAATAVDMQGKKASEKIISYFRNEMKATAEKTGRPPELAEAMVDEDVDIEDLAPKGKLLTLTTSEAVAEKIAEYAITVTGEGDKLRAVLAQYELQGARVTRQSVNWSEQVVRWLTHPIVASLLMSLGFLGLIFEIQSPGWGVGGTIGLICLGLFFGSHMLVKLADWTEVLLFLVGVIMVIADLFFIAGFGVLAIPGVILMFAGLFLSLMGRSELWTWESVADGARPLLLAFITTILIGGLMLKMLPRTSAWKWLVLQEEERRDAGYIATGEHDGLLGKEGVAFTPLRPSGTGLIEGRRVNVAADGEFIEKNSPITVIEVEGNRIVVRKTGEAS
ncbi:MAG: nodulation protein NfeD [Gemmatimonadota bacterium]|nr:nodulation protein NfeD [Gemmatimonadota bacterium]